MTIQVSIHAKCLCKAFLRAQVLRDHHAKINNSHTATKAGL
jgi:hypothetical protein